MSFSRQDVEKVALLSRLRLSEEEIARMSVELGAILEYIDQLNALDTTGVEPLSHPLPIRNVFREDELGPSLTPDEALANTPKRVGDFYAVPAILE